MPAARGTGPYRVSAQPRGWPRAQRIARRRAGAATWVARAARPLVCEHCGEYDSQWAAITSIAEKFGMTAETLRGWVRQAEVDDGSRPGTTTVEAQRIKELERENRELRRANEILKAASVFFSRGSSTRIRRDDERVHRRAPRCSRGRADLPLSGIARRRTTPSRSARPIRLRGPDATRSSCRRFGGCMTAGRRCLR
ncbi:MAG: transposase, partial [Solirubrobacteraceae bacterium]|nr:transposase [Solirubrobacteraceae bacterium]